MSDDAGSVSGAQGGAVTTAFRKLRADGQARMGSTLAGVVVGLAAAWLHPVGLVVGGALVAVPQRTVGRGLLAGVGFGVVAVAATFAALAVGDGTSGVTAALAMRQVTGASVAIGLAAGLVGGLVRGVV